MELSDLHAFLAIVQHGSLQEAANQQSQTPSALSKALRRLESSLGSELFDRSAKPLRLNSAGERLRLRAEELVRMATAMRAEFRGRDMELHCRICAPPMLLWRHGPALSAHLLRRYPCASLAFEHEHEQDALLKVARGAADFSFVTKMAIDAGLPAKLSVRSLGPITMQLACGVGHALAASQREGAVDVATAQLLEYDFACPSHSPFCGVERGGRADGWRDDQLPRRIRYWVDDMQLLLALVREGRALAYLPDFALAGERLLRVQVRDCPYHCVEEAILVWKPSAAHGWHEYLADFALPHA